MRGWYFKSHLQIRSPSSSSSPSHSWNSFWKWRNLTTQVESSGVERRLLLLFEMGDAKQQVSLAVADTITLLSSVPQEVLSYHILGDQVRLKNTQCEKRNPGKSRWLTRNLDNIHRLKYRLQNMLSLKCWIFHFRFKHSLQFKCHADIKTYLQL